LAPAVAAQLVIAAGAAPEGGADPTQFLSQYTSGSLEDKAAARKQHEGDALEALKAGYSGNSFAGILAARLGSMSKAAIDLIVTNNRIKGEIKAATGRDTYYRPPAVSLHDEALGQREKPIADPAFVTRNPNGDREAHAQMLKLNTAIVASKASFVNHQQQRTAFESDTGRSALAVGTGLHAPDRTSRVGRIGGTSRKRARLLFNSDAGFGDGG